MSDSIRIVVADDHPLFREGVVTSLAGTADMTVVGQAENADEAVRIVRDELPDLALLDITMPGGASRRRGRLHQSVPPRGLSCLPFQKMKTTCWRR